MIECYLDESGTDDNSPTAVVGGILLQRDSFFWFDIEWGKVLDKYGIDPPFHMREFGPHGRFKEIRHDTRRALFSDLVKVINDNKTATIAATLTTEQYRRHYSGLFGPKQMSVYGLCFLLLATLQAKHVADNYKEKISFIMDSGNRYRHHVVDAHSFLQNDFQPLHFMNAGGLAFDTDQHVRALQAADLLSWSVRRRLTSNKFTNGFETLVDVFNPLHIEQPFKDDWMEEVATNLHALRNKS